MLQIPPEIDTSTPHPARMYDYMIGGKDNFAADRQAVEKVAAVVPGVRIASRENRAFLGRAVRFLAAEAGGPRHPRHAGLQPAGRARPRLGPAFHPGRRQPSGDHQDAARGPATGELRGRLARHLRAHSGQQRVRRERPYQEAEIPLQARDSGVFAELAFSGLELVSPGVVLVSEWRPDEPGPRPLPSEVNMYGGVAKKP